MTHQSRPIPSAHHFRCPPDEHREGDKSWETLNHRQQTEGYRRGGGWGDGVVGLGKKGECEDCENDPQCARHGLGLCI